MGKSIYGISVAGETYYPRPIYTAKLVELDVQEELFGTPVENNKFYQICVDDYPIDLNSNGVNESIIIKFNNSYRGLLYNSSISFSDSLTIYIQHNNDAVHYIDVDKGDYFELINRSGSIWDIVSMNKQCMDIIYENLVVLRDNSGLIPGMKYRITDYVTMDEYCPSDAQGVIRNSLYPYHHSTEYPFDIIVTAETKKTLNPIASAAYSNYGSGSHFSNCDFSKWKLWYSLDCTDFDFGYKWGIEPGKYIRPMGTYQDEVFYGYNYTYTCVHSRMTATNNTLVYITPAVTDSSYVLFYAPYFEPNYVFRFLTNAYSGLVTVSSITEVRVDDLGVPRFDVTMSSGKTYLDLRPVSLNILAIEDNMQDSLVFYETQLQKLIVVNISEMTITAVLSYSGAMSATAGYARLTKGVIYRMIDEWGNDAPYDFKNIVSYTPGFENPSFLFGEYGGTDTSLDGTSSNNTIHPYISGNKQGIPYINLSYSGAKNCVIGKNCYNIFIPPQCNNVTIGNEVSTARIGNTMSTGAYDISIGGGCNGINIVDDGYESCNITIGNCCESITISNTTDCVNEVHIGNDCNNITCSDHNIFGNYCYDITCTSNNTFGDNCYSITCTNTNIFGDNCRSIDCSYSNTFGLRCYNINCMASNIFGDNCYSITCTHTNTFGLKCYEITCGSSSTFGNWCCFIYMTISSHQNTFGQNCTYIYSGSSCNYNIFGNYVSRIVFALSRSADTTDTNLRAYCQYNVLHDGVKYVVIYTTYTASSTAILRNVHIDTPATYGRTSYKFTGASGTTGAVINASVIQRYKFTTSETTYTLS